MSNPPDGSKVVGQSVADAKAVGDAARQAATQARQAGADAVGHAKDVAQDAQARAASLAGELGGRATAAAETQKSDLAGRLEEVAQAVHRSGEQLEGHQDWLAHLVEQGADELGTLAGTLRANDLQSLLGSLGSLASRQPALFVGASMAAGFALARVGRVAVAGASRADLPSMPAMPKMMPEPKTPEPKMPGSSMSGPKMPGASHERN